MWNNLPCKIKGHKFPLVLNRFKGHIITGPGLGFVGSETNVYYRYMCPRCRHCYGQLHSGSKLVGAHEHADHVWERMMKWRTFMRQWRELKSKEK